MRPCKVRRVECPEERIGLFLTLRSLHPSSTSSLPNTVTVTLKDLFSDFVVREIPFGDTKPLSFQSQQPLAQDVHLSDNSRIGCCSSTVPSSLSQEEKTILESKLVTLSLAKEDVALVSNFMMQRLSKEEERRIILSTPALATNKTLRSQVHQTIREVLGKYGIVSSMDDGKFCVMKATKEVLKDHDRRTKASEGCNYLHFTLYKENADSNAAMRHVAKLLGIGQRTLQFCGTKDKRAVTLQRVACRGLDSQRLSSRINNGSGNTISRNSVLRVGDFEKKTSSLSLGQLAGNHFTIVLRVVKMEDDNISTLEQQITDSISNFGFINYYGPQRFGTTQISSSDIGIAIIRHEFRTAVSLILESRVTITPDAQAAVVLFDEGRFEEAFHAMPHFCPVERDILKHLACHKDDFLGALSAISRTLCMLYCHSVQSLAWNFAVSKRLTNLGPNVVVGDLVLRNPGAPTSMEFERGEVENDDLLLAEKEKEEEDTTIGSVNNNHHLPKVVLVTREDVALKRYQLQDVVMPLPGPDEHLVFPSHCSKEVYCELLRGWGCEGLLSSNNAMVKRFLLHGAYRSISVVPWNFSLTMKKFEFPSQPLIETREECGPAAPQHEKMEMIDEPPTALLSGLPGIAWIARFGLPAGSYATCLLREFCTVVRGREIPGT